MNQREDMKWLDRLDHIVYCTNDFQQSIDDFEDWTGVRPTIGGKHLNQGTKNALVRIGERAYFEILAIDQENTSIKPPRWMGIDLIDKPKITRWAINSNNIRTDADLLNNYKSDISEIIEGKRQTPSGDWLQWKMTKPAASPEVEVMPFLLDWSDSEYHPCDRMGQKISVLNLTLYHDHPNSVQDHIIQLNIDPPIQSKQPRIRINLKTPKGIIAID